MAKTPPKPTGDKILDLVNLYNYGYKWNKVGALLKLKEIKKDMARKKYKIELGDPSADGHGMHEDVIIMVDGTENDIEKAFKKLESKGINFHDLCSEYDDSNISVDVLKKMQKIGVNVDDLLEEAKGDNVYVDYNTYATLIVDCLNAVKPKLNIDIVDEGYIPSIGTFGYGLFTN